MEKTKTAKKRGRPKKIKKTKKVIAKKVKLVKKPLVVKPEKYWQAVGKRKSAIARIRLWTKGEKIFLVNKKPLEKYFPLFEHQETAKTPLEIMKCLDKFRILAKVEGGGLSAQAEALRHALARALVLFNPNFRKRLKKAGFLKRDARVRERKKFGLKRARRAPQWQKR